MTNDAVRPPLEAVVRRPEKELLERAARAAGIEGHYAEYGELGLWGIYQPVIGGGDTPWNPLQNDGQAFRLAIELEISVKFGSCLDDAPIVTCSSPLMEGDITLCLAPDFKAKTRLAIVRAAAAIDATLTEARRVIELPNAAVSGGPSGPSDLTA